MQTCPICGSRGQDLVFKFYCRNPLCQNYEGTRSTGPRAQTEVRSLLRSMWKIYGVGESEEEFVHRFFTEGGEIMMEADARGIEHARIREPDWLRRRMSFRP